MARRILFHGFDPSSPGTLISDRAVAGCWFEWLRLGGCGAGELRLNDNFADRFGIEAGHWVSIETSPEQRWYLGRVESTEATYPAGIRVRLEGMGVELGEVFPGGFGSSADGVPPQRFGATDRFSHDPDRDLETFDPLDNAADLVRILIDRYVAPITHIDAVPALIENSARPSPVDSLKMRGEESARSIIKELAVRAGAASWGVNHLGQFFFLQRRTATTLTLQLGRDITDFEATTSREYLFNRVLLTGDYVYDRQDYSGELARRIYRWRGNYVQPASRAAHGERRLRMWVPWIRTQTDSLAFLREFFRTYSEPTRRYQLTTTPRELPTLPWLGAIQVTDSSGETVAEGVADAIRVTFDRVPRFQLEIGPEDPRTLWPEPPHDERWELPDQAPRAGGHVSVTDLGSSRGGGGGPGGTGSDSSTSSDGSSGSAGSDHSDGSDDSDASDASDSDTGTGDDSDASDHSDLTSDTDDSDPFSDESTASDASDDSDGSADDSDESPGGSDGSAGESDGSAGDSDASDASDGSDESDESGPGGESGSAGHSGSAGSAGGHSAGTDNSGPGSEPPGGGSHPGSSGSAPHSVGGGSHSSAHGHSGSH